MTETTDTRVELIPIDEIHVLNPRSRNKKVFEELKESIRTVGLKRPIAVSRNENNEDGKYKYTLACGQGRLEAVTALGESIIPAVVVNASESDCLIMSLVENMARRHHSPLEIMQGIRELRDRGYSHGDICRKTGLGHSWVIQMLVLLEHGEERLIKGVELGQIPLSVATEIAHSSDQDVQNLLTEIYEKNDLTLLQINHLRKIVESRKIRGKFLQSQKGRNSRGSPMSADSLIRTFQKETDRQRLLIKKAELTQQRLLFIINAFKILMADQHFRTLLRAEQLDSMPRQIAIKLQSLEGFVDA